MALTRASTKVSLGQCPSDADGVKDFVNIVDGDDCCPTHNDAN